MKVIIAGSRDITSMEPIYNAIKNAIKNGMVITEVVSGGARGVDTLGEMWADLKNIPIKRFPADWDKHGRAAGPIRNQEMADYADALIAVWDTKSPGTKHMIDCMRKLDKHFYVEYV